MENISNYIVPGDEPFSPIEVLTLHTPHVISMYEFPETSSIKTETRNKSLEWDDYSINSTISLPTTSKTSKRTTSRKVVTSSSKRSKKQSNAHLSLKKSSELSKKQKKGKKSPTKKKTLPSPLGGDKKLSYEDLVRIIRENNETKLKSLIKEFKSEKTTYKQEKIEIKKRQLKLVEKRKKLDAKMTEIKRIWVQIYEPESPAALVYSMEDAFGTGEENFKRALSVLESLKTAREQKDEEKITEILTELFKPDSTSDTSSTDGNQTTITDNHEKQNTRLQKEN